MAIKPKPFTYKCSSCGWEKIIAPKSDAYSPLEYYESCPHCGSKKLKKKTFSTTKA